ncbi:hypothetical protein DSO57_1029087 [Entomophthora muscae]|uniref:Uncharacterized protein n=1 Tax=Entomophthora muscae TaxID=34485 RepID=A0ACC2RG06_9FUNG|nr:hypothetical protein DSO57_1029087 [Entomophthora muscae]
MLALPSQFSSLFVVKMLSQLQINFIHITTPSSLKNQPPPSSHQMSVAPRANPVCDRVLWIQNPGTLIFALGWRCTTIGFQYTCCCDHMFGCSHVFNCNFLDNFPLDLGPVNVLFECNKAKYAFLPDSEYSLLDCLLNHGKFYLFRQCLPHILSSLGLCHPVADNNSGSSRASTPEPEPEAHEQISALRRPASQKMIASKF